jgi:2TM domain
MRVSPPTQDQPAAAERVPEMAEPHGEDTVRRLAIERIHRLRRFKVHLIAFGLGVPVLGAVWVLTEYFEEHTWPRRFASAPDVAGTWDPWFFFVAGIWFIVLAIHALRAYLGPRIGPLGRYIRRPIAQPQLDREIERLKARRQPWTRSAPRTSGRTPS